MANKPKREEMVKELENFCRGGKGGYAWGELCAADYMCCLYEDENNRCPIEPIKNMGKFGTAISVCNFGDVKYRINLVQKSYNRMKKFVKNNPNWEEPPTDREWGDYQTEQLQADSLEGCL